MSILPDMHGLRPGAVTAPGVSVTMEQAQRIAGTWFNRYARRVGRERATALMKHVAGVDDLKNVAPLNFAPLCIALQKAIRQADAKRKPESPPVDVAALKMDLEFEASLERANDDSDVIRVKLTSDTAAPRENSESKKRIAQLRQSFKATSDGFVTPHFTVPWMLFRLVNKIVRPAAFDSRAVTFENDELPSFLAFECAAGMGIATPKSDDIHFEIADSKFVVPSDVWSDANYVYSYQFQGKAGYWRDRQTGIVYDGKLRSPIRDGDLEKMIANATCKVYWPMECPLDGEVLLP